MVVIHKLMLEPLNSVENAMFPVGKFEIEGLWQVLAARYQRQQPVVWIAVDPDLKTLSELEFVSIGTGHGRVLSGYQYLATLALEQDPYIWHLFYIARLLKVGP